MEGRARLAALRGERAQVARAVEVLEAMAIDPAMRTGAIRRLETILEAEGGGPVPPLLERSPDTHCQASATLASR